MRLRSFDPDNLRILLSDSYRPCSQENDKYDFDPQEDLIDQLHLDMGRIYRDLEKQQRFGFLPAMASSTAGQIGALMAESFCERILSCAKQVVHRHRLKSVNAEREYSMVVILRMNRAFIGVHAQAREGL